MANIMINDLTDSVDLDRQAMEGLTGGHGYRRRGYRHGYHHCNKRWGWRHHRHHWRKPYYYKHNYYKKQEKNYNYSYGFPTQQSV
jgi:hypothetical protein